MTFSKAIIIFLIKKISKINKNSSSVFYVTTEKFTFTTEHVILGLLVILEREIDTKQVKSKEQT